MARNAEKAATELSRWYQYKLEKEGKTQFKVRPYLATECHDLKEANSWRREIIQEISMHVTSIQNAQLGEFRLRDLNDHINKLLREKGHWEDRIKELGGADYKKTAPKMLTRDGKEVPGNKGYRYFGAARDLPGVRELFDVKKPEEVKKNRAELMKFVDADYFGYRDEDDGIILSLEKDVEEKARRDHIEQWRTQLITKNLQAAADESKPCEDHMDDGEAEAKKIEYSEFKTGEGIRPAVAHIEVPTQFQVQEAILLRKKRELMARYASDAMTQDNTTREALKLPPLQSAQKPSEIPEAKKSKIDPSTDNTGEQSVPESTENGQEVESTEAPAETVAVET